jgi:hypothetical protein
MVDNISCLEKNLKTFIAENTLPCYANVNKLTNNEESTSPNNAKENEKEIPIENRFDEIEEIYLIKIFESDCIFARSYSSNFEQMLINQRTSFAQSDLENLTWASNYLTVNQNRKNLVSEEVVIPLRYEGYYKN